MKKFLFMLMLAAFTTAIYSNTATAQISMISSIDGTATDTLANAGTLYFTTPVNALSAYNTGKYRISFHCANVSGTSTFKVITQGTIDGTNWIDMHQIGGTDGKNCDTLQVTSAVPADWTFNCIPGVPKVFTAALYSVYAISVPYYTQTGRVIRLRLKIVGTGTQSTFIGPVKCLIQN